MNDQLRLARGPRERAGGSVGTDAGEPAAGVASVPGGTTLHWVSWMRWLAIAGVVTIHVVGGTAAAPWARESRLGQLAILLDIGFVFTVPLFVMISGALLLDPRRYRGPREFLRRRTLRIVPALVVWHFVYWGFRVFYLGKEDGFGAFLRLSVTGDLYPHLYFFWIVLGLAVVAPVLIPWIASATKGAVLLGGCAAAAMPIFTVTSQLALGREPVWVDTPWTWWIFYLGFFLLGWGLRDTVLRGTTLVLASVTAIALAVLLSWQWRNPDAPTWLQILSPVSYYGVGVHLYAVLVFLVVKSLIRPGGVLGALTGPRAARVAVAVGGATMGIFALHMVFVQFALQLPVIGGDNVALSSEQLVARASCVFLATLVTVLVLRRVPFVRSVL